MSASQSQKTAIFTVLVVGRNIPRSWIRIVLADLKRIAGESDKLEEFREALYAKWITMLREYPSQTITAIMTTLLVKSKSGDGSGTPSVDGAIARTCNDVVWRCEVCGV